jgi:hypothetical protein
MRDHVGVEDVVAVAHRPLPEADAAGGDEQVPTLAPEPVELGVVPPGRHAGVRCQPCSTAMPAPTLRSDMAR